MNYRHAFHAGNFADIVKHAALTLILRELLADPAPLSVIDTHGGAGGYDLEGEMARRSGESEAIVRLMADAAAPVALGPLKEAVARFNKGAALRFYPGSPWLVAQALRRGDRLTACELHPEDHTLLVRTLTPFAGAEALKLDGYATAAGVSAARLAVLIDPPFERPDDYEQAVRTVGAVLRRNRSACVAVWLPLKDLETFDAFLRALEPKAPGALIAEVRLRPLIDPMRMNGCALAIVGPPPGLAEPLAEACEWTVSTLGEPGGRARVWRLGA